MMSAPLEMWAGAECSIVRVGRDYRDQEVETGHGAAADDLARVADLGIRTIRFPMLWEKLTRFGETAPDWDEAARRLERVAQAGLEPIVGLVHHGSGPRDTSLLSPDFASRLAEFAGEMARRFPHIRRWTPVNEPLTTARFSCLYGHWYPNTKHDEPFVRATVNQCLAVSRAMTAIRAHNPAAELIQTEDIGRVFATPLLEYHARFENNRRLLSLDLLTGKVGDDHPLRRWLAKYGATEGELAELRRGEGRPDLVGVNHYLTSDRFLDERAWLYAGEDVGGNGRHRYVDVAAVRVSGLDDVVGPRPRLVDIWERYGIPVAITEAHNGCTREEQLRWFHHMWDAAVAARDAGADVRAVTAWAVWGAVDWTSLLKRRTGFHEDGLWDLRGPTPRLNIIGKAVGALARTGAHEHPVLKTEGWWKRPSRFHNPGDREDSVMEDQPAPVLITGATGTLGKALARVAEARGLAYRLTARGELDLSNPENIRAALDRHKPWAVINAAGYVRVPDAEREPEACFAANVEGAMNVARVAAQAGLPSVHFSSDLVFSGTLGRAYLETDAPDPTTVYGESKARLEAGLAALGSPSLCIRTSAFFGPWDRHNFVWAVLRALARGETFEASRNVVITPTYVPDLANRTLDLLVDGETGLWHIANEGAMSWHGLAELAAAQAGVSIASLRATDGPETSTALGTVRHALERPVAAALAAYLRDLDIPFTGTERARPRRAAREAPVEETVTAA